MRAVVGVLVLFGLLVGGVQSVASAPDAQGTPTIPSVRMDVRAGFDGAGRVGGWVPLDVQLVNEGSELKAQVEVVVEQPGGRSTYSFVPTTFSLPVVLPRMSHHGFSMEVNLPNATNIPLGQLAARLSELDSAEDMVIFCKSGGRSARGLELLVSAGFKKVKNLKGGINAWAKEVDKNLPVY